LKNSKFIDMLVSSGIISEEESRSLLNEFKGDAFSVLMHSVRRGLAKRTELGMLWGDSIGFPYIDLGKTLFQNEVVEILPEKFARKNKIIFVFQFGDAISAATSNPADSIVLKEAEMVAGRPISPVFSFPEEIKDAIEIHYRSNDSVKELSGKIDIDILTGESKEVSLERLQQISGDHAVIEFVREVLLLGIKERASDIHIEPSEESVRVRFRIDGVLQERFKLRKPLLEPVVARLKVLANANIIERRRPQDGRITLPLSNGSIDFRFSVVPTVYGEKAVLRILGQVETGGAPDLSELGFSGFILSKLKRVINTPNGVFFVTGPTGSGKTTTLFAVLKQINKPGVNIMTIEDPIEYRLPGINQVQTNAAIDLNFASALRAFLRQDPDVILVGEIRDIESAKIAAQAALTGHLVMSTIHTNNALQAITRLIQIGVEPFLVAPSIIGVMAQRLVRKICDDCKESYPLSPKEIEKLFIWDGKRKVSFYKGKGCSRCNYTGYFGRLAIYEIFIINEEVRALIAKASSILEIQESAKKHGFQTMRYDGLKKVLRGLTTIEEVNRVTIAEEELI